MNLFECMMTHSTCYKETSQGVPVGILWHDTGAGNPNLKRYVQPFLGDANYAELIKKLGKNTAGNDWNHIKKSAGVNAWIGKLADGSVATVQTLPWNYMPWGCGQGSKGSCNGDYDGPDLRFWIQFEIADDGYKDKKYFDTVYKEACELTAYLCKKYHINPNGTVDYNGVKVPTILCHKDAHSLKLGSNHADVTLWFNKFGKTMNDVRKDVAEIITPKVTPAAPVEPPAQKAVYRIRKSWADSASQVGAYSDLENAKKACDKAGAAYYVFDESGKVVYPVRTQSAFKVGDIVKLVDGATYTSGKKIASWVFKSKLYVRQINGDGNIVVSILKIGPVTGTVAPKYLVAYSETPKFQPYKVKITADVLNVRAGAGTGYKVKTTVKKNSIYTIVEEQNGFGKLKSGAGWISLTYTERV